MGFYRQVRRVGPRKNGGSVDLSSTSVVELHPLHLAAADDGGWQVGRVETGTFVALPAEGVALLEWLRAGATVGAAGDRFTARYGEPVDVAGFLGELADCGFVARIDGRPPPGGPTGPQVCGWRLFGRVRPQRVAWLASRPVTAVAVAVWLAPVVMLLARPQLWPQAHDALLVGRPLLNVVVLTAVAVVLVFLHECGHVLAARAVGCPSTLTVGHRLHLLVVQTDMSAIRAQPPARRYRPYLAGMTVDLSLLGAALMLRVFAVGGGLPAAVSYLLVVMLLFQLAFFLRTDIYYVLVTWLRLGNLMGDTRCWVVNRLRAWAGRPAAFDLSAVPARELRWVRAFAGLWLVGGAVVLAQFVVLQAPALARLSTTALGGVSIGPGQAGFWEGLGFLGLIATQFGLVGRLIWRDVAAYRAAAQRRRLAAAAPRRGGDRDEEDRSSQAGKDRDHERRLGRLTGKPQYSHESG